MTEHFRPLHHERLSLCTSTFLLAHHHCEKRIPPLPLPNNFLPYSLRCYCHVCFCRSLKFYHESFFHLCSCTSLCVFSTQIFIMNLPCIRSRMTVCLLIASLRIVFFNMKFLEAHTADAASQCASTSAFNLHLLFLVLRQPRQPHARP